MCIRITGGLKLCLLICLLVKEAHSEDAYWISTPGYPNGYSNIGDPLSFRAVSLKNDQGVLFKFARFELGPADCLYFCDGGSINKCSKSDVNKLCGKAMELMRPAFYYEGSPSVTPILVTNGTMEYYPGFRGTAEVVAKATQDYYKDYCNKTIYLKDGEPKFLVSDHFPKGSQSCHNCIITYVATEHTSVRAAIYSFETNPAENMVFTGADCVDRPLKMNGTISAPRGEMFSEYLQISYYICAPSSRFFIVINSFTDSPHGAHEGCLNRGAHWASLNDDKLYFEIQDYPRGSYGSNLDCRWYFNRNQSENSQLSVEFYSQTEPCCDMLMIDVTEQVNLHNLVGVTGYQFYYAQTQYVHATFQSDGLEGYAGFQGKVLPLDCDCGNPHWNLTQGQTVAIQTPGGQKTYCQNIWCDYTIDFPTNTILQFHLVQYDLYQYDSLTMSYYAGYHQFQMSAPDALSSFGTTKVQLESREKKAIITSSDKVKTGFTLSVQARNLDPETFVHDLCSEGMADIRGEVITTPFKAHIHKFTTSACDEKIYTYLVSIDTDTYDTLILDGERPLQMPANQTKSGVVHPIIHNGTEATIRVAKIGTKFAYARILVTTDKFKPTVIRNSEYLSMRGFYTRINIHYVEPATPTPDSEKQMGSDFDHMCIPLNVDIYKGATLDSRNLVMAEEVQNTKLPAFVFGPYLTLVKQGDIETDIECVAESRKQDLTWAVTIEDSYTTGILMSPDYATNGPLTNYDYSIKHVGHSSGHVGIVIELLRPIGSGGTLTVVQISDHGKQESKTYDSSNGAFKLKTSVTELALSYNVTTPDPLAAHGFILRYSVAPIPDANVACQHLPTLTIGVIFLIVLGKI